MIEHTQTNRIRWYVASKLIDEPASYKETSQNGNVTYAMIRVKTWLAFDKKSMVLLPVKAGLHW